MEPRNGFPKVSLRAFGVPEYAPRAVRGAKSSYTALRRLKHSHKKCQTENRCLASKWNGFYNKQRPRRTVTFVGGALIKQDCTTLFSLQTPPSGDRVRLQLNKRRRLPAGASPPQRKRLGEKKMPFSRGCSPSDPPRHLLKKVGENYFAKSSRKTGSIRSAIFKNPMSLGWMVSMKHSSLSG